MKLQDMLPDGVTVDGKFYKMDFDFRNVLKMIEVLDRDDLMPEAKAYKALLFLQKRPKNAVKVIEAVKGLLFKAPRKKGGQKVTDFIQDAGLIRAAFRQAYGIDLYREKLHWIEFTELLNSIPEGSRYAEVVGIRARPMPAATKWNQHEREWLARAKADVALEMSDKERAQRYEQDVANIAAVLMGLANAKEVKQDG
ncbi:MAG: hypothetical protein J6Q65_04160 [Lentisphaeria bacterium]|nr:hypothetical protein [Lentisphaeria bacterium]